MNKVCVRNLSDSLETKALGDPEAHQGPSTDLQGAVRTFWELLGISRGAPGIIQGPSRDFLGLPRDPPGSSRDLSGISKDI